MIDFADGCYRFGHIFAQPFHDVSYKVYQLITTETPIESCLSKVLQYTEVTFLGVVAVVSAIASVVFSSLGSLFLTLSNQNYLVESSIDSSIQADKRNWKILNYNVGFLPGELAQELTVGRFEMSSQERKDAVIEFLFQKFQEVDILLLEETMDFGFITSLKQRFSQKNPSIYFRIGDPLALGISSGLSVISKTPLAEFKVEPLPLADPFFSRSFVTFKLPGELTVVHAHLKAGDDDLSRLQQLQRIGQKVNQVAKGILIGDFNFSDRIVDFQTVFTKTLQPLIDKPTIRNPSESESHPDFVATFGEYTNPVQVQILEDVILSDHFPIEITI